MTSKNKPSKEQLAEVKAKLSLRVPGLKQSVGAGDVVHAVTRKLGLHHCDECAKRKERLNRWMRLEKSYADSD